MYKLSESVEILEIEHTWTKLWPFEGGGPNRAFHGQKSIGSIIHRDLIFNTIFKYIYNMKMDLRPTCFVVWFLPSILRFLILR